jgi:hypothetical protein
MMNMVLWPDANYGTRRRGFFYIKQLGKASERHSSASDIWRGAKEVQYTRADTS